jgi:N-acetylglucosamine-6-phosphate deacetylase
VAGLVDLQVNGFAGVDFLGASAADHDRAGEALLAAGVTAYQPTLITAPEDVLADALRALPAPPPGRSSAASARTARVLGAQLEGPFLSPQRLGAHPAAHRRDPDLALLERLLAAGPVTTLTLAPELPGAHELIRHARSRGLVVGAGHTDATAAEANAAFDLGVSTVNHLFNAMRPFAARDPGIAGVALTRPGVVVQLIVDGRHLADEAVRLVWAAAAGRVALVSDATAAAAAPPEAHRLGEADLAVVDGAPVRADGVLAGTTLTLLEAVRNLHALGVPFADAVGAATAVPARVLGRTDVGVLEVGGRADVLVLDDRLELVSAQATAAVAP